MLNVFRKFNFKYIFKRYNEKYTYISFKIKAFNISHSMLILIIRVSHIFPML